MEWYDFLILAVMVGGYFLYRKFQYKKEGIINTLKHKHNTLKHEDKDLNRKEETALKILQEKGYSLQEVRPVSAFNVTVNGKSKPFNHQARFAVEKEGKSYLVAMKKTQSSPLNSASLRKDLLLDYLMFQPAGIFLYDGEKKSVQEVSFSFEFTSMAKKESRYLKAALIVLIVAGGVYLLVTF